MTVLKGISSGATPLRRAITILAAGLSVAALVVTGMVMTQQSASASVPGTGLSTLATDHADGDKELVDGGVVNDVVNYGGLTAGVPYVLKTEIYNKTDGAFLPLMKVTSFTPTSPVGTLTVTVPLPTGLTGKTLVVYQTVYVAADVQVGTNPDSVTVLPGKDIVVEHVDPNNADQTVSVPASTCSVSGVVWSDENRNQLLDAGEPGIPNVTVDLRGLVGQDYPGTFLQTTTTDANGHYSFTITNTANCAKFFVDFTETDIPAGSTAFAGGDSKLLPTNVGDGWSQAYSLPVGGSVTDVNMGVQHPDLTQLCTISGTVWLDQDKDGQIGASETRVGGAPITVYVAPYFFQENSIATGTTDANGFYRVTVPSEYCDRSAFVQVGGTSATNGWSAFTGGASTVNPDYAGWPFTYTYPLVRGGDRPNVDVGLRQSGLIQGTFCPEAGDWINGGVVTLINTANGEHLQSQTVQNNSFAFQNVPSGRYWVYFERNYGRYSDYYVYGLVAGGAWSWTELWYYSPNTIEKAGTYEFDYTAGTVLTLNGCYGKVPVSPIALDLNGNGAIDTSNLADQAEGAAFDLLGTGSPVQSGWLAGGDGFLVAPNADGSVTSIANLFGGALGEGYAKLSERDVNGDGQLTGAELDGLAVWVDANGDHTAQPAEITSLASHGVTSLGVDYVNDPVANNGNAVIERSRATTASGGSMLMGDAYFQLGELNAVNAAAADKVAERSVAALAGLSITERLAILNAFAGH